MIQVKFNGSQNQPKKEMKADRQADMCEREL